MVSFIERAVLYDISRFSRQFIHEQDVQDFHVTERTEALDISLKPGAVGNQCRSLATVTVSVDRTAQSLTISVDEYFIDEGGEHSHYSTQRVDLAIEGDEATGLLSWLRLSLAGWLDAARGR